MLLGGSATGWPLLPAGTRLCDLDDTAIHLFPFPLVPCPPLLMLPSVLDHLADMLVLQHTAEGQPQRSRALPLEQRFARIEAEILRFWGCQQTSPSI